MRTATKATKRWHHEKNNGLVPQDQIRAPDADGLPRGTLITRLGVITDSYVDDKDFETSKSVRQQGHRRDRPTSVQLDDMNAAFRSSSVLRFEEDEDFAAGPSSSSARQPTVSGGKPSVSKMGGSLAPGQSKNTAKKLPKIKNVSALSSVALDP